MPHLTNTIRFSVPVGSYLKGLREAEKRLVQMATQDKADWIEKTTAPLITEGVALDRIKVQEHPMGRTVIADDDGPRAEMWIES